MADRWVAVAKRRWPRSKVHGEGQFAVLTCPFYHTSGREMMYSEVSLFETRADAEEYRATMYCHAETRNLCAGKHDILDLAGTVR
jgi:hypothetical protein